LRLNQMGIVRIATRSKQAELDVLPSPGDILELSDHVLCVHISALIP
jgi:hypothetical protein